MKFFVILVLFVISAGLSFWNFFPRGNSGPAALQVFSKPAGVSVTINDENVGVTPYKNQNLTSGEIKISIGSGSATFAKFVKLNPKVFTIVNRELANNPFLQAGEVLSLEPGAGLVVISAPEGASVEVNDKPVGQTPINLQDVEPGTHKVVVTAANFISRSVQVQVHKNYRLVLDVTLAVREESLGKAAGSASTTPALIPKVRILATPTGFLRVRDNPSLGAVEIGQVRPGEEFSLLEERPGWFKMRLQDSREGWISSQYAQKL